jgi:hypothetical protein
MTRNPLTFFKVLPEDNNERIPLVVVHVGMVVEVFVLDTASTE